jgi:diguanylate cyclase (GGDEF)-like protein
MFSIENRILEKALPADGELESLRFLLSLNETVSGLTLSPVLAGKAIEKLSQFFLGDYVSLLLTHRDSEQAAAYTSGNPVTFKKPGEGTGEAREGSWETLPLPGTERVPVFRIGGADPTDGWIKLQNLGSEVNVPVRHKGNHFGLLSLCRSHSKFQDHEVDLIRRSAEIIGRNLFLSERFGQLERFAFRDGLTGIGNRRSFDDHLDREFKRSQRYMTPLALVLMDADHFKNLNDRFGHQAGDEALRFIAETVRDSIRQIDSVFRYGGEEFAVLLPETGGEEALLTAERIRKTLQNKPLSGPWGKTSVTASLGVSFMPSPAINSSRDLVGFADWALYQSKQLGRNRVIAFPNPFV